MFDVNRGTADMATQSRLVPESREQNERKSLEQERNAWFATLDSNRLQFKEARERIRAACDRAQQNVRIELANQARLISCYETGSTSLVGSTPKAPEGLAPQCGRSAAKRRQPSAANVAPKRPRLTTAQKAEARTTTIDEVRRHNAAGAKSMIIKFNGLYYIIRQHALAEAAKHLQGACHGYPRVTDRLIVQSFGVRVVDCNDALALMNNACVTEVPASGYKQTSRARGYARGRKFVQYMPRAISGPHSRRAAEEEESL
ncbi:hypothetical protein Brms1b_011977 [Colletotrichum noveboracense]|nr:hypothetical protein Brms1b_011977 [Colletotrichum noveboracense]